MSARLLSGLAVPAVLVRPDDVIEIANPAAENFLNASVAQLHERGWPAAFAGDTTVAGLVRRARAEGGSCAAYDVALHFPGGRVARADVLVSPVADHPDWLAVAFQTRSAVSLLERQVQQRSAARSAVGVAAMLAHEIKNPLSGIRGAAQLLSHSTDADGRELTGLIVAEVDRIAKLIDRMESFTDTRPQMMQPLNIHEIIGHARRVAEQGFARDALLIERYDPSLPPVLANRDALVQLFLNLIKNAAEAIGNNGQIWITTAYRAGLRIRRDADSASVSLPIEVRVMDTGPGIDPALGSHVFEPFVSGKSSGTGLGLPLAAKIVADHGGVIEYERAGEPEMTVFRVLLPVARA